MQRSLLNKTGGTLQAAKNATVLPVQGIPWRLSYLAEP